MDEIKDSEIEKTLNLPTLAKFKQMGPKIIDDLKQGVLVSINIKNFKYFNEVYSSEEGDWLLLFMMKFFITDNPDCVLGTRSYIDHILCLSEGGGLSESELKSKYADLAERFLHEVNRKYTRARVHLECGLYVVHRGEDFLKAQDNARYARRSIRNSYTTTVAFYRDELRKKSLEEAAVIPDFTNALENHEIIVLLQPKYSASSDTIVGAEALSRFKNSQGRLESPAIYVPVLEESGLIPELDRDVIFHVIDLQRKWMDMGKKLFPISVNLSRVDFYEKGFIEELERYADESGIPHWSIEFELTETAVVENLSTIVESLEMLSQKGYRIALDDFGAGYNSLYVLGKIPANVIKFDRGFVLYSIHNEIGKTILKNLIKTFREIRFEVLCEGVETEEEKKEIVACGCDVIQGYLYDKPLSIADFESKYIFRTEKAI